ncbi:alkaline phosphatase [Paenibacillus sp. TRM 82003]|uniref:alkaline phosphatase n=1 Tax=Kineococcus sp. TRM81007 TaxID=2925831 RepID=UPI001F5A4B72|nr:alkaline phosphatase [Kineococcus sp. TRM81007]MCI2237557.1 alkaline phosphatase [Kineococcus sp. TRM81007]MCI3921871.1 alkaline phosphatase [Paenibacillus sp. TRM 82003]
MFSKRLERRTLAAAVVLAGGAAIAPLAPAASAAVAEEGGPKNVIVLIGDGMGHNQIDFTNSYLTGTTNHQVAVDPADGEVTRVPGTPAQVFQEFPVQLGMSTGSVTSPAYDPELAWGDFEWVTQDATDSAAAGTAMATGVKTENGVIGLDADGSRVENLSERAAALGKAAGVVSSVPFSHATPAAFGAHNPDRNDLTGVTNEYLAGNLDVVIGAGHPWYDDDHQRLLSPRYDYISQGDYERVSQGRTPFTFVEETSEFERLATVEETPDRVFGAVQVASTLQQGRTGVAGSEPFSVERNDVPTLGTLTEAALNVLDEDEDGFFAMVEGGAIDWAGHANDAAQTIEETAEFFGAVDAAVEWVETESSWDETLLVVTADHETGYLAGPGANPNWTPIAGAAGQVPAASWNSTNHTNGLVPVFAQGAGAEALAARAVRQDPVRGAYVDSTDLANVLLEDLWADGFPPMQTWSAPASQQRSS